MRSNSARTAAPTAPSDADRALRLVDERAGIASLLNPLRRRLLEELAEPDRPKLPRQEQRLRDHLERQGFHGAAVRIEVVPEEGDHAIVDRATLLERCGAADLVVANPVLNF